MRWGRLLGRAWFLVSPTCSRQPVHPFHSFQRESQVGAGSRASLARAFTTAEEACAAVHQYRRLLECVLEQTMKAGSPTAALLEEIDAALKVDFTEQHAMATAMRKKYQG